MKENSFTAKKDKGARRRFSFTFDSILIFTPIGCIVLVIALAGLIFALNNRNSYEIVLACTVLFLMLVLGVIGAWKSYKLKTMEPCWKPPFPMTANAKHDPIAEKTHITGLDVNIPLFFRLHFYIRGRFSLCGMSAAKSDYPMLVETSIPQGETSSPITLNFPMSGVFNGNGYCLLRDIFGLFSFRCGMRQYRTVNVRSAPCIGKKTQINAQTGAEDQRNKPAADIERYYMREYTPGDRFRDINWKSSDKIDTLITRISTDNQEKISRLEIYFRNYGQTDNMSLAALWLLDRAKARLAFFLRSLMDQNSSFVFDIHTANGNWEIADQNDLDNFLEELAGISFYPPQNEKESIVSNTGDIYVFSTACDVTSGDVTSGDVALHAGLPAFLVTCNQRPVTLFLVQPAKQKADNKEQKEDIDVLRISDFTVRGCTPSLRGLVPGKLKPLSAQTGKTEMFYAELKL
jgi:hypothetical protein